MSLEPGTRIGPYEVGASIGAGGMGEVYRATDTKLRREVAIKVLPEDVVVDRERLARFQREAQVLASLNHPNIAAIYGLEESGGIPCLVLELVEGRTLAEILEQGPLPPDEAREFALQIAAGMEAAHEKGIIHRDLKPANVKITPEGAVKVLDFGLAKALADEPDADSRDASLSPTLTAAATRAGVIMGTAAYMSPEQARGKRVNRRADIWAFGCVYYECLTGRQCFGGETISDLLVQVLQSEPDWEALPPSTPPRIRRLLGRCLEKDHRRRLRDIGDARIELEDETEDTTPASGEAVPGAVPAPPRSRGRVAILGVSLVVISVLATVWVMNSVREAPSLDPVRFEVAESGEMIFYPDGSYSAISPDGRKLAFVVGPINRGTIWVRSMDSLEARQLQGTDGAYDPFWSPDGEHIAFFSFDALERVPLAGGAVQEVCKSGGARGGTWNRDGVILFANEAGPLFRVPASGGDPEPITTLDATKGETAHRFPYFLPDGRHYVYSSLPPRDGKFDIYLGELGSSTRKLLMTAESGVVYAEPGYLMHQKTGAIVAREFDASRLELGETSLNLRGSYTGTRQGGGPGFSVSREGTLAYARLKLTDTRLAWFDAAGHEVEQVPIEPAPYVSLSLSPDERRVALVRKTSATRSDIWIGELERGVVSRLSQDEGQADNPRWSPDGTRIAYALADRGPQSLVIREVNGKGVETFLESDPDYKYIGGWTPDGKSLVYDSQKQETGFDVWVLPLEENAQPKLYLRTPFLDYGGSVSPDGRWLGYVSNESGRTEGYVQPFPDGGARYQVTKDGGYFAKWLDEGRKVIFVSNSSPDSFQVADVIPGGNFRLGPAHAVALPSDPIWWDVANDGKRVLALMPSGAPVPNAITVVLHWERALERN